MPGRPGPSSLRLPLLMSVLLHAAAGALGARWSFDRDRLEREARDRDPAALPPEDPPGIEPEPEPIQLGLADSRATSLTWLGFDKFEEQFAAASEVDQPELTMDPSAGPVTESLAVAMADAAAPTPESSPPSPAPAPEAAPAVDAMPHESEATTPEPAPQAERALPPPPAGEGPIEEPGDEAAVKPVDADETRKVAEETKNPEEPRSDPPTEEVVVVPPAAPRVAVPAAPASPATPAAPSGSGAAGTKSDRESVASSIVTAEWKKLGQPFAGHGLEIRTRRPKFTHYTSIMGAARNPIVRVHFRRDGKVEEVELIQSSGNADVDRPVLDAIYLWRATGEPLNRIPMPSPPATYPVEFRILM